MSISVQIFTNIKYRAWRGTFPGLDVNTQRPEIQTIPIIQNNFRQTIAVLNVFLYTYTCLHFIYNFFYCILNKKNCLTSLRILVKLELCISNVPIVNPCKYIYFSSSSHVSGRSGSTSSASSIHLLIVLYDHYNRCYFRLDEYIQLTYGSHNLHHGE